MVRSRGVWALAAALAACAHAKPGLGPGQSVERALASGDVHDFAVALAADTVLSVGVDQFGVDVIVTAFDPEGRQLSEVDSPLGATGTETIAIDAKRAGTYRLRVRSFPGAVPGRYRLHVDEIVPRAVIVERAAARQKQIDEYFAGRASFVGPFLAWAKTNASDDLSGIDRAIGDARVVTLAEADHGAHEYLAFRNDVVRHLVGERGFTAYVVETGFAEGLVLDAYVMGTRDLSPRDLAGLAFAWAIEAPMQENVELMQWLRAHNADPSTRRKVHVYGMDLTGGRAGLFVESRRAIEELLAYLATAKPDLHRVHRARLAPLLPLFDSAHYVDATPAQRAELTAAVQAVAADAADDAIAARQAFVAVELERFFRETRATSRKGDLADPSTLGIRDAAMASNVVWALDREGPDGRVIVFTHNAHARRGPILAWELKLAPVTSMGEHLGKQLGDSLVVIGAAHADAPGRTFDHLLQRVGRPRFLVDLRAAAREPALRDGLLARWDLLNLGLRALVKNPVWSLEPSRCFDAMIYYDVVTPAHPVH